MIDTSKIKAGDLLLHVRKPGSPFFLVQVKPNQDPAYLAKGLVSVYPTTSTIGMLARAESLHVLANANMITGTKLGPPGQAAKQRRRGDSEDCGPGEFDGPKRVDPDDLIFCRTCEACPEQYDVLGPDGTQAAYVRLRWGGLTCRMPDSSGEVVYSADIGDLGMFESDEQREQYLGHIAAIVAAKLSDTYRVRYGKEDDYV